MNVSDFTGDPRVTTAIDRLKGLFAGGDKIVSDIVDGEGHQFVDLVMEGGGVLGIALVGYTYALESVGIRFLGVGGTSAGAINAALVAGLGSPAEKKSERTLAILSALKMFEFVDGDGDARDFVEAMVEKAGPVKLGWKALQVIDNIRDDLGLNPGREFRRWVKDRLAEAGIRTVSDLAARMRDVPADIHTRAGKALSVDEAASRLAIIAADITTETRVEFPRMASLYFADPDAASPSRMVRASMSIPAFFHPCRIRDIPHDDGARARWDDMAGYRGEIPKEVLFVDGGIMSNFPIDVFHGRGVPDAPTFGVKLGTDRAAPHLITGPSTLLRSIFDSARHTLDYEFIRRNPDYRHLVARIPTDGHDWLNFFMKGMEQVTLFAKGVRAAEAFLTGFDWKAYKGIRAKMAGVAPQ